MKPDKDATKGCLIIVLAFLAVTIGLPWANAVIGFGGSGELIAWIFVGLLFLISAVAIPRLLAFWIILYVVVPIAGLWIFGK